MKFNLSQQMKTDANSLAGLLLGHKTIHHPELGPLFRSLPTPPDRWAVVPSGATAPASASGGGAQKQPRNHWMPMAATIGTPFGHYTADRESALNEF